MTPVPGTRVRRLRLAGFVSLGLMLLAMVLPSYMNGDAKPAGFGIMLALLGWTGPLFLQFGWYANLPWIYAIVCLFRGRRPNPIVCAVTVLLSLNACFLSRLPDNYLQSETGVSAGPGLIVWFLAMLVPLITTLLTESEPPPEKSAK